MAYGAVGDSLGELPSAQVALSILRNPPTRLICLQVGAEMGEQRRGRKPELPHKQASGHTTKMLGCIAGGEVGMIKQNEGQSQVKWNPARRLLGR